MSQRHIRKMVGGNQLPPPDSSDEEFQPKCTLQSKKNVYAGLEVSSDSEEKSSTEEAEKEPKPEVVKKRRNKKKKHSKPKDELDEIDRTLKEINAIYGEPPKPVEVEQKPDTEKILSRLFTVRQKDLIAEDEMNRRFGPDDNDDQKKRGRQPNLRIISKKGFIIQTKTKVVYKKNGLTMIYLGVQNGLKQFVFQHSKNYQNLHNTFLRALAEPEGVYEVDYALEDSQHGMHVEGLLEMADRFYFMEEYTSGNKIIELVINYMQHCAHPFFSVTDRRSRLEYTFVENRPFHIALLKYMHMLTNKACHRTALEIAKLLLNLDPSDPLAVLFIIDSIAIRAGEYQWIIDAIDYWTENRDAGFLYNMQYSYALATFQLVNKEKEMYEKADELIKDAMLRFPAVLVNILQYGGIRNPKIKECPLFTTEANAGSSPQLRDSIILYAKFIWHKFCERSVLKWLVRNATELAEKYENDDATKELAKKYADLRLDVFHTYPTEVKRHLSILTPLSDLVVDGVVPPVEKVVSYDPFPPCNGVSIYEPINTDDTKELNTDEGVNYFEIFTSMSPDYELQDAGMEHRLELPTLHRAALLIDHPTSDESETETDSDENEDLPRIIGAVTNDVQPGTADGAEGAVEQNNSMFIRLPFLRINEPHRHHFILASDMDTSSDDEMADRTANIVDGPSLFSSPPAASDADVASMNDSDGSSDPVIATFHIRDGARFYRDLYASFASNESMEVGEPIDMAPEITTENVRIRHFFDDHAFNAVGCNCPVVPSAEDYTKSDLEQDENENSDNEDPKSSQGESPPQDKEVPQQGNVDEPKNNAEDMEQDNECDKGDGRDVEDDENSGSNDCDENRERDEEHEYDGDESEDDDMSLEVHRRDLPELPRFGLTTEMSSSDESEIEVDVDDDEISRVLNVVRHYESLNIELGDVREFLENYNTRSARTANEDVRQCPRVRSEDSISRSDGKVTHRITTIQGPSIANMPWAISDPNTVSGGDNYNESTYNDHIRVTTYPAERTIRSATDLFGPNFSGDYPKELYQVKEEIQFITETEEERARQGRAPGDFSFDSIRCSILVNHITQIGAHDNKSQEGQDQNGDNMNHKVDNNTEMFDHEDPKSSQEEPPPQYEEVPHRDHYHNVEDEDDDNENYNDEGSDGSDENRDNGNNDDADDEGDDDEDDEDDEEEEEDDEDADEDDEDRDENDEYENEDEPFDLEYFNSVLYNDLRQHAHTQYRRSVLETRVLNGFNNMHRFRFLLPSASSNAPLQQENIEPPVNQLAVPAAPAAPAAALFSSDTDDDFE